MLAIRKPKTERRIKNRTNPLNSVMDARDGIRTHEHLRDRILSPALLARLRHPRAENDSVNNNREES